MSISCHATPSGSHTERTTRRAASHRWHPCRPISCTRALTRPPYRGRSDEHLCAPACERPGPTRDPACRRRRLLLVAALVARLAQQLAVLLLRHALAALLDDGTHGDLTRDG